MGFVECLWSDIDGFLSGLIFISVNGTLVVWVVINVKTNTKENVLGDFVYLNYTSRTQYWIFTKLIGK